MIKKFIIAALMLFAVLGARPVAPTFAAETETLHVAGLTRPVEILKDRCGISHIYAKNEDDLFFAQGYNVARDRLFQLEIWRRQATGTVAQILGRKELKRDVGARLFMFRGDLKQELNWYHLHGQTIVEAFVKGVNAYIGETEKNPNLLTPEFRMLGIKPGKWTPAVVITRFNGLLANVSQEVNLAQAVRVLGADKVKDLEYFQPANPKIDLDQAIDASLLARDILELYSSFRGPISFTPDELTAEYRGVPNAPAQLNQLIKLPAMDPKDRPEEVGSNNWVVSGKLTPS